MHIKHQIKPYWVVVQTLYPRFLLRGDVFDFSRIKHHLGNCAAKSSAICFLRTTILITIHRYICFLVVICVIFFVSLFFFSSLHHLFWCTIPICTHTHAYTRPTKNLYTHTKKNRLPGRYNTYDNRGGINYNYQGINPNRNSVTFDDRYVPYYHQNA